MAKRVIDVSSYQGKIDWKKVKAAGVEGAIIKIIRKDLRPDNQFENNWSGCVAVNMPVLGVYNYSYATTVSKAVSDAKKVIQTLAGRKARVWLDVEDQCLKGIGFALVNIIKAYQKEIEAAGLDFGVYTGISFYNSYIRKYEGYLSCRFWIARYPSSKTMTVKDKPPISKQPVILHTMEGWQFTSSGSVPGINGRVDMNEWYGEVMHEPEVPMGDNPYPSAKRLLKLKPIRMKGDDVRWAQWHLVRLGFLAPTQKSGKSSIDGIFGPATDKAVRAAQEKYGIVVDGIIGANTVYVIKFN